MRGWEKTYWYNTREYKNKNGSQKYRNGVTSPCMNAVAWPGRISSASLKTAGEWRRGVQENEEGRIYGATIDHREQGEV